MNIRPLCYLILLSITFILVFTSQKALADQTGTAFVEKIIDGDSILVSYRSETTQVRLWGIDTPEYSQSYSKVAKKYTGRLVNKKRVRLEVKDWDNYGRMVAMVTMEDGKCLNEELLKAGLAWVHIYYCKEPICNNWYGYEKRARKERIGLWREKTPLPPWEWKRKRKH
ncbi:MAG: thermonuclease family protein [Thermodesulfobacteriota bacterium]